MPHSLNSSRDSITSEEWDRALLLCAEEKIHLISQIQGGYVLLAMDLKMDRFTHLSENADELLGISLAALWATPPSSLLGAEQLFAITRRVLAYPARGARLVEISLASAVPRSAWAHFSSDSLVLEISTAEERSGVSPPVWEWDDAMRLSLRGCLKNISGCDSCQHSSAHRQIDHRFRVFHFHFVVPHQTA